MTALLQRRHLRAAYIDSRDTYRLCCTWVEFDRADRDAQTSLLVSRFTLERAREEYLDSGNLKG